MVNMGVANMGCIFILPPNDRDHPTETCEALMLEKTRLDTGVHHGLQRSN